MKIFHYRAISDDPLAFFFFFYVLNFEPAKEKEKKRGFTDKVVAVHLLKFFTKDEASVLSISTRCNENNVNIVECVQSCLSRQEWYREATDGLVACDPMHTSYH